MSDPKTHSNQVAEQALIGCCMIGGAEIALDAIGSLPEDAFTSKEFATAWAVLKQMVATEGNVDAFGFLMAYQRKTGNPAPASITSAPDKVPSAYNFKAYVAELVDCYQRRCLLKAAFDLQLAAENKSASPSAALLEASAIIEQSAAQRFQRFNGKELGDALLADAEARFDRKNKGETSGHLTGLAKFDYMTDGIQPGELMIIAARPSQGKTALGISFAWQLAISRKIPTLIFTAEMSPVALARRMASSAGEVSMNALRRGIFTERDFARLTPFLAKVKASPLHVVDGIQGMRIDELTNTARAFIKLHGIKVIVVDYLQKILPSRQAEKRAYEIAEVSGGLKALANGTGVAVVALAQLNRDNDKAARLPRLSDLADSGQIERDADTVALIHRPESPRDGEANACLILAKQRDGETGPIALHWNGAFCRFENPTNQPPEPEPQHYQ